MFKKGVVKVAKKNEARDAVILKCVICSEENYRTEKNKRNTPDKLEIKKYCPKCQKTVLHKEKK